MMQVPFIFTSEWSYINLPKEYNNQDGVVYKRNEGEHSIWAARVPFIPSMISDDLTRPGTQRTSLIQQRQFRFIYDLARIRENQSTFTLRFISTPNTILGQPNLIDMVFLGKVFSKNKGKSQYYAESLWERFFNIFPMEDPFGYPLIPISSQEEFLCYYQPITFSTISPESIYEIRKFEDMPISSTSSIGRVERKGDYIAHPFVPNQNFNPMGRFLLSLSSQPQKCFVDISIRPTRMFDQEILNVSYMIGQFKKSASEDNSVTEEYIRKRSQIGLLIYDNLMLEREQLLMVRVHIVGDNYSPLGLAESLGSEMMGNIANKYPTTWVPVRPADEKQMQTEIYNLCFLEHDFWGTTIAPEPLVRLRYLATAQEAYGAFRLPVPSESEYMPGILVRNEPFVTPSDELEHREKTRANFSGKKNNSDIGLSQNMLSLGKVYHRGTLTSEDFSVSINDLTRHTLIAGSTGSGKTTTIKHILSQLWIENKIPFLVLYPVNKPDYRDLGRLTELSEDLLIFTLADETVSPFRFNPFEVPEGILIKTHISRLMRVFQSAFSLLDPLPMIYREGLRKVYRDKGWNIHGRGKIDKEFPIMSEFFHAIKEITDNLNYGHEVQDNVRQASVIRIGDLLENAGHVVNVRSSMSFTTILSKPVIIELGQVGSMEDISLLMGFLLTRLQEEIEIHPRRTENPHITVVEEAHRLMSGNSLQREFTANTLQASGEDFSNMLSEVRGYGEGIIIAEQIPTMLVKGAIGNTYLKIMHWLEDPDSYDLFLKIMNLNTQQANYARTLKTGFAIVRSPYGEPVHLKIPDFGSQFKMQEKKENYFSDERISADMKIKKEVLGIKDQELISWADSSLSVFSNRDKSLIDKEWFLNLPMQTCVHCPWLKRSNNESTCHRPQIERHILLKRELDKSCVDLMKKHILIENNSSINVAPLSEFMHKSFPLLTVQVLKEWTYCFLAHKIDELLHSPNIKKEIKMSAKHVLIDFIDLINKDFTNVSK
ncbi:MAG: ATP-binding protein [Anaerolineaceae bacterium]